MSSVVISWTARCTDRAIQQRALGYMRRLAALQRKFLLDGPGPRPEISRLLAQERGERELHQRLTVEYDGPIAGRIALCSDLVPDGEIFARAAERYGLAVRRPATTSAGRTFAVEVERLALYGIDFQVYDPRGLYPGEDRLGCVFLRSPELPAFDGLLAKVSGPDLCARITVEHLRGTEWYVECPFLHLRDHLEDWSDRLLAWFKFFLVPDLTYRHREPMGEYAGYAIDFARAVERHGEAHARDSQFEDLLRRFEDEAIYFGRTMGRL